MALELFSNQGSTTVTSGGTTAPAAGTSETWTVASSSSFPAASSTASPPTQFHVADPAATGEIIEVTTVSGTTWTVTRGAESTTPVAHAANFTICNVVTAKGLGSLLAAAKNLSDVASASTALGNLGVSTYYAPAPSGGSDDAAPLNTWLAALPSGVTVCFPPGTYKISSATLQLPNGNRYIGAGAGQGHGQTIFQRQSGATISGAVVADAVWLSASATPTVGQPIHVEGLTIDGNQAADSATAGHGLVTTSFRSLIRRNNVRNTPQAGIVLADQTRAGYNIGNSAVENRVMENTVSSSGTQGIWIQDHGTKALTDGYLQGNVVNTPGVVDRTSDAIRVERAAGWFIRDNHPYNNPANGFYFDNVYATWVIGNECDQFGKAGAASTTYYAFYFHRILGQNVSSATDGHPLVCIGNQAWADETLGQATTQWRYYSFRISAASQSVFVSFTGNGAHQRYATTTSSSTYPAEYLCNGGALSIAQAGNVFDGVFTGAYAKVLGTGGVLTFLGVPGSASTTIWSQQVTALAPSATANTLGTVTTLRPGKGFSAILLNAVQIVGTGTFASETLTVQVQASFSDNTTQTITKTFTSTSTYNFTPADMRALAKDGLQLLSLSLSDRSTIANSAATAKVTCLGWNGY
jgi:hypothetical protein